MTRFGVALCAGLAAFCTPMVGMAQGVRLVQSSAYEDIIEQSLDVLEAAQAAGRRAPISACSTSYERYRSYPGDRRVAQDMLRSAAMTCHGAARNYCGMASEPGGGGLPQDVVEACQGFPRNPAFY